MGYGARVFVSPAIEYTNDTTIKAFVDNAPEGEIGVFLEDGTLKSTALTAGQRFFIAQKRDGLITRTPVLAFNDIFRKSRTAFEAPVTQVTAIGYNGSTGSMSLDFTGASSTSPKELSIEVRDTSPGNQPFPIQEAHVVVTSATADEYDTIAKIVSQLNADNDLAGYMPDRFVKAEILANGALTELAEDLTVVNGSTIITAAGSITINAGTLVSIRGTIYKVVSGGTGTSFTLDRPYQGASETIDVSTTVDQAATMAYTSGTTELGIRLTAILPESHFKVTVKDGLADATVTAIAAWKLGSGYGASVVEMEKEGIFFDGVGSTANAAFREDYGYPTLFASASLSYNLFFIDLAPAILPAAALPNYKQEQIQRIIIAAPTGATTPDNELKTIFGV